MDAGEILLLLRHCKLAFDRGWEDLCANGLSIRESHTLLLVEKDPGMRVGQIRDAIDVHKNHATRIVNTLEASGLVRRERENSRHCRVLITPAGRSKVKTIRENLNRLASYYWGDLPAADLEAMERVVNHLLERSR